MNMGSHNKTISFWRLSIRLVPNRLLYVALPLWNVTFTSVLVVVGFSSLKDTDLQWSYSIRDHWYTNHAQSSKSKQSNKNVSKKFKVKYVHTIHFLECSSQVCRVGKANKPKSLSFASPLISDNLDIVLQAHKIFSFKPYQKNLKIPSQKVD
jgi:hypothetical protein